MKICRICQTYPKNGAGSGVEPHFYYVSKKQVEMGNEVTVIAGGDKDEFEKKDGVNIYRVKIKKPFVLRTGFRLIEKLEELIKTNNFDVIHIQNPIMIPYFSKDILKIPIAFTLHGSIFHFKRGVSIKDVLKSLKGFLEFYLTAKFISKKVDIITAISSEIGNEVIKEFGVNKNKVVLIHAGVDVERFRKVKKTDLKEKLKIDGPVILSIGRFVNVKGFQYLIDAMISVNRKFPTATLLLVGGNESDDKYDEIMQKIKNENAEGFIKIIGAVPHSEIQNYYSMCDIYVQSSISSDLPKSILEAIATGKPVVATDMGNKEVVSDGKNGFLVPPKNSQALSKKIEQLLGDRSKRIAFGKESLKISKTGFSWDDVARKYLNVYKEIIRKRRG